MKLLFTLLVLLVVNAPLVVAGDFAFEEFHLAPVRVHLLSAKEKARLTTTLTPLDIQRIVRKANEIWAPAGIQFYVESVVKEVAPNPTAHDLHREEKKFGWLRELCPEESKAEGMFHLYFIKELSVNGIYLRDAIFIKDTAVLTKVPGGITEPLPRVTAHELGHALSLLHREDKSNLMASGTTGTSLNETEIKNARLALSLYPWIESAAAILKRADELYEAGKTKEARTWYERLAKIPGDSEAQERIRLRAKK